MTYIIRGDISRPEAPLQNLPSSSSSSYPPGSFRSQADNVCHYRLHNGLRLHAQICALSCGNSLGYCLGLRASPGWGWAAVRAAESMHIPGTWPHFVGALKGPSDLGHNHDKCPACPDDYTEPDPWHQRPRRFGRRGSRAEAFRAARSLGGALRIGSATRTRKSSSVPRAG